MADIHSFSQLPPEVQALYLGMHKWYTHSYKVLEPFYNADFRVLVYLLERDDRAVSPRDLTELLGVTRQRVSTILSGLRGKGFIQMEVDPDDRRRMLIRLTEEGMRYFIEQSSAMRDAMDYVLERLGADGARQFLEIIDKLIPEGENDN